MTISRPEAWGTGQPLSYGQRHAWLLDRFAPGTGLTNLSCGLRLTGPLERDALAAALARLPERYETFRTGYKPGKQQPAAFPTEALPLRMESRDLSGLAEAQREETLCALLDQGARRALPLEDGRSLRAVLFRLGDHEHVLALTAHRIACDEQSMALLLDETAAHYRALTAGEQPAPTAAATGAAEHAAWQHAHLESAGEARHYWLDRLAALPDAPLVPADRERPDNGLPYEVERLRFPLPTGLRARLDALSEEHRATPYMLLLTGFTLLAARVAGRREVVLGALATGRTRLEFEQVVGVLANTLVLRTDLTGVTTGTELLRRVRAVCLDAYDHQDIPMEWLRSQLAGEREPGMAPLARTLFVYNGDRPPWFGTVRAEALDLAPRYSLHDLVLTIEDQGTELTATLEYATALYDRNTAENLAAAYVRVLSGLLADPEQPLAAVAADGEPADGFAVRQVVTGQTRHAGAEQRELSGVEEAILQVWCELLETDSIDSEDNFFDVGGHSHLLVQEVHLLQERLGVRLRVVDFFRHPTPRALAAYIRERAEAEPDFVECPAADQAAAQEPVTPEPVAEAAAPPAREAVPAPRRAAVGAAEPAGPTPEAEPETHHPVDRREQLRRQRARHQARSADSRR
ncbi:condensation domain-containing protein [Streptomyces noursei]|uniref:condensation domain-containing protein n=1 Tax=Streptomyces noursei TaxID=1971 RepID=UPI0030F070BB